MNILQIMRNGDMKNYYGDYRAPERRLHTYLVRIKLDFGNGDTLVHEATESLINPGDNYREVASYSVWKKFADSHKHFDCSAWEVVEVAEISKEKLRDDD